MSTKRKKRLMIVTTVLVLVYLFIPFIAGLIGTNDRRGPKIFWVEHHELFYMFGYYLVGHQYHDGKPRVPPTERTWFYGMKGKPLNLDRKMQELQDAIKADESKSTNN